MLEDEEIVDILTTDAMTKQKCLQNQRNWKRLSYLTHTLSDSNTTWGVCLVIGSDPIDDMGIVSPSHSATNWHQEVCPFQQTLTRYLQNKRYLLYPRHS